MYRLNTNFIIVFDLLKKAKNLAQIHQCFSNFFFKNK
jgi:hypothetical protein